MNVSNGEKRRSFNYYRRSETAIMTVRQRYKFKTKFNVFLAIHVNYYLVLWLCCVLKVVYGQQVAPAFVNEDDHSDNSFVITPAPSVSRQITTFGRRQKGDNLIYRYMYASTQAAGSNGTVQRDLPYPPRNKKVSADDQSFDITCVQTIDIRTKYGGGTASIVSGGVGHRDVIVRLKSFTNKGFYFIVNIYGKHESPPVKSTDDDAAFDNDPSSDVRISCTDLFSLPSNENLTVADATTSLLNATSSMQLSSVVDTNLQNLSTVRNDNNDENNTFSPANNNLIVSSSNSTSHLTDDDATSKSFSSLNSTSTQSNSAILSELPTEHRSVCLGSVQISSSANATS